jgi:hypothetical protein
MIEEMLGLQGTQANPKVAESSSAIFHLSRFSQADHVALLLLLDCG